MSKNRLFYGLYSISTTTYTFFIIFTRRLVPSRSAPSSINFSASAKEEIPPAAFFFHVCANVLSHQFHIRKSSSCDGKYGGGLNELCAHVRHVFTHLDLLIICQKACLNDHFLRFFHCIPHELFGFPVRFHHTVCLLKIRY